MATKMQEGNRPNSLTKFLKVTGIIILLSVAGYYANKTIQTNLGQQAIDETGLEILSLEQALEVAKNTNKMVLADMSAIWCPSCRKLDQQVFSDEDVKKQIKQSFVYARVEYDSPAGESFMQQYKVSGFPTLLVLNAEGRKLVRLPVSFEPKTFITTLQHIVHAADK
jgi:thiol:disulfide interchange protein